MAHAEALIHALRSALPKGPLPHPGHQALVVPLPPLVPPGGDRDTTFELVEHTEQVFADDLLNAFESFVDLFLANPDCSSESPVAWVAEQLKLTPASQAWLLPSATPALGAAAVILWVIAKQGYPFDYDDTSVIVTVDGYRIGFEEGLTVSAYSQNQVPIQQFSWKEFYESSHSSRKYRNASLLRLAKGIKRLQDPAMDLALQLLLATNRDIDPLVEAIVEDRIFTSRQHRLFDAFRQKITTPSVTPNFWEYSMAYLVPRFMTYTQFTRHFGSESVWDFSSKRDRDIFRRKYDAFLKKLKEGKAPC